MTSASGVTHWNTYWDMSRSVPCRGKSLSHSFCRREGRAGVGYKVHTSFCGLTGGGGGELMAMVEQLAVVCEC